MDGASLVPLLDESLVDVIDVECGEGVVEGKDGGGGGSDEPGAEAGDLFERRVGLHDYNRE